MALSRDRQILIGTTAHQHEAEAVRFIINALPDNEPYSLWALCELAEPGGRLYEIDALVLGYHALYLVEIKSHPGTVSGDQVDWTFRFPEGREIVRENPMRLTEHKARVLSSMLERKMGRDRPWVQAVVFLSAPDVDVRLTGTARDKVVTRANFLRAMTHGELPGAPATLTRQTIDRPTARATRAALAALGLRESKTKLRVGDLHLSGELLEEGPGYQDRLAEHPQIPGLTRRVRCYLVPLSATDERRAALRRAAEREARVLLSVGDHPGILSCHDYRDAGPLGGPCVVLDHFADAMPLDVFLRKHPDLSFDDRIDVIRQIGDALGYCHRKEIFHRNLHPGCILVRRGADKAMDVRLHGFQLAADDANSALATTHPTGFLTAQADLYRAPELFENPAAAGVVSDMFSLGAVAWHVLIGRPPGTTLAERQKLLDAAGHLSLTAASDALADATARPADDGVRSLEAVVAGATNRNPVMRLDDAQTWVQLLLEAATRPDAPPATDPLEARPGDRLLPDVVVAGVLGTGASSHVLLVRRAGRELALKVPRAPEHEERLRSEDETLQRLQSERVVRSEGLVEIGGRTCLFTTYAGLTLAEELRRKGPVSLDYARRWGEDLLAALQALEDAGICHRDVKPANLGILPAAAKKARHLLLLDFSLAAAPADAVTVGTPAYRDPFLLGRGRWDAAADRFAAAVTLHEMLTGVRPRWGADDLPATATDAAATIEAERFDPAVRDRLAAFFTKALARDVGQRHASAEEMRVEWVACFASRPSAGAGATAVAEEDAAYGFTAEQLAAIRPDTPVAALPLTPVARSALDRSGVMTAHDLATVPANQLSVIRGVGRRTAREVFDFITAWSEHHRTAAPAEPWHTVTARFADVSVEDVPGVSPDAATAFADAGLRRVADIAAAPRTRVERLLANHTGAAAALRRHLDTPAEAAPGEPPDSVEAWLDALLPVATRRRGETWKTHVRLLLGVDHHEGRRLTDARELARTLGVTPQMIYASLGKAREVWRAHPALDTVHAGVQAALDGLGGVAPLARVAEALRTHVPHRMGSSGDAEAAALVRIAAETTPVLHLGRIHDVPWLGVSEAHVAAARDCGARADALAVRTPLPSSDEVREALIALAAGTPLDGLPPERLVALAADASRSARASARLELYPKGLAAGRALKLVAAALPADAPPALLRDMVRLRYPDAEPVPDRPALDVLAAELELDWNERRGCYHRRGTFETSSAATNVLRTQPLRPDGRALRTEDEQARHEFETRIRLALEQSALRVLEVNADHADRLAKRLRDRFKLEPRSLERELLAAMRRRMAEAEVPSDVVLEADRRGPGGDDWKPLTALAADAATDVLADLRAAREPVVLTPPGLLTRYGLRDFLAGLLDLAQSDAFPACFVVVPTDQRAGAVIDGGLGIDSLPVPTTTPAQRLTVPTAWLEAP